MRTEQCYCMLEAAKTGSFTRAAEKLFMKQPSLRANINALEDELGQPLFKRSKSGVTLTKFGEFCYPHILHIVETYELMKKNRGDAEETEKPLSIGATRIFSSLLGQSYSLYEKLYPKKKCIFFSFATVEEVMQKILSRQLDIGLLSYFPELRRENKWFQGEGNPFYHVCKIMEIRNVAIMRSDHPLARHAVLPLEELENYLVVFFSESVAPVLELIQQKLGSKHRLKIAQVIDEKLLFKYILEEEAVSFTLDSAVRRYSSEFKCIALEKQFTQTAIAVYSDEILSERAMEYIDIVKSLSI